MGIRNKFSSFGKAMIDKGTDYALTTSATIVANTMYDGIVYVVRVIKERLQYEKEIKEIELRKEKEKEYLEEQEEIMEMGLA